MDQIDSKLDADCELRKESLIKKNENTFSPSSSVTSNSSNLSTFSPSTTLQCSSIDKEIFNVPLPLSIAPPLVNDNHTTNNAVALPSSSSSSIVSPTSPSSSDLSSIYMAKKLCKLKRFLTTLQQFACDISQEIGDRVRNLILNLIVNINHQILNYTLN
jgi:hypothetical protein